ncbi:MAG: alpha/beta hydrolase [Bacteroidales bacterium]|nr:alpha/beta hydrolase [Bacteroidales bacterium]
MASDSVRYKDQMFEVDTIKDVVYANVKGYWDSYPDENLDVNELRRFVFSKHEMRDLDLKMDIYLPKADTAARRPLIVFAHGGAFYIGDKGVETYKKWCSYFASLGYVCASINYRLGFPVLTTRNIEKCEYRAMQDAHAAIRYLVENQERYGIDTTNVFAGGTSAGSIMMLAVAYMKNENRLKSTYRGGDCGALESSGNDCDNTFKIKGLANMWGAVYDLSILENNNVPIVSFHGDADKLVPYDKGLIMKTVWGLNLVHKRMYGSNEITKKAKELGINSILYTYENQGHALHLDKGKGINQNFYDIQYKIRDFLFDLIDNGND